METQCYFGKMILNQGDLLQQEILKTKNWESHHDVYINKYINKHSIVLDIGGHVGTFSLKCAHKKCKKVFCFEPFLPNYLQLINNIKINNYNNIFPQFIAIANKLTTTTLSWTHPNNTGMTGLELSPLKNDDFVKKLKSEVQCPTYFPILTKTIDSFGFEKVDFIKIDTEGCELLVIKGAINTIQKFRPVIIAEHNNDKEATNMLQYLNKNNCNYNLHHIAKTDYIYTHN